ncbi:amidohydrolase, partial [Aureobasidium melanogenum]
MEKEGLPQYSEVVRPWADRRRKRRIFRLVAATCLSYFAYSAYKISTNTEKPASLLSATRLQEDFATCAALQRVPEALSGGREYNKRYVNGTRPVLIQNATVWTGEPISGTSTEDARKGKGFAWIQSDVFIEHGLIRRVAPSISLADLPSDYETFNAHGRQLTAGIVDMHSHAGLGSLGGLQGDENELSSDITPYVKSLDSLDPLHPEIQWIKSGGVTTSLLLPGSGNNIGGEAFLVKLAVGKEGGRAELSQQDMLADPDRTWRYMKNACGENPKRVYGKVGERGPFSRMGEGWEFRHAFEQARDYVKAQDDWCAAAKSVGAENMNSYLPQKLEWENLGAVLRGQVRVNTHCYTIPDLEMYVRLTNEFKFRVYAFHHAHQTYLVPDVLKRAYGGTPAAALFGDNMYYKVESYRASEQSGKILYENGITPVYVSDNPVINSQHVKHEAAKAYGYGLPYHAALNGLTSAPAELLGMGERLGKVKPGFDADIVVWDSDPLSLGAAPVQVWIDGAPQFKHPVELKKPLTPPIKPDLLLAGDHEEAETDKDVVFTGVTNIRIPGLTSSSELKGPATVVVSQGKIVCAGSCDTEARTATKKNARTVALRNGYLTRPLTAFGSGLGLQEIMAQPQTHDGSVNDKVWAHAVDGLLLDGKNLFAAYRHGVTKAISAPMADNYAGISLRGVSAGFLTGAKTPMSKGAVFAEEAAVHYDFTLNARNDANPSISSLVADLRHKLLEAVKNNETITDSFAEAASLKKVVEGKSALVLSVHSADAISALLRLKSTVEYASKTSLRLVVLGAAESHLVAEELAAAKVAVVLAPLLPWAQSWDQRRSLMGAPLHNGTAIDVLLDAGVRVAIGVDEIWETRDLGLTAGIALKNSEGRLTEQQALDLVSTNFYDFLGLEMPDAGSEFVVYEGSPLEIGGRVVAIADGSGKTEVWV